MKLHKYVSITGEDKKTKCCLKVIAFHNKYRISYKHLSSFPEKMFGFSYAQFSFGGLG